jgi:hypothetical protein
VTYTEKIKFRELLQIEGKNALQSHWLCVELVVTCKEKTKVQGTSTKREKKCATVVLAVCRLCCTYKEQTEVQGTSTNREKKCATNVLAVCRLCCDPWTDKKRGAAFNKSGLGIEHWSYTGSVVVVELCNFKKQGVLVLLYRIKRAQRI